ncbi:AAA family ATPase [Actinoplanes sp. NPDC051861]|uniref:AAA family ATPase n=1 Tax=Actinoplanes sp. NPDC051861 TaxID=3155170 RepID=UPI00343DFAE4
MRRILIVGMSGSGKTTAARRVARRLGLPFHEMDVLAIGPGWSIRDTLVDEVDVIVRAPGWVFDSWGYPPVRDMMWAAADTVVWLDYPRRVVLPRLLRRSLSRTWRRERLFGGNVERWRGWLEPSHPLWFAVRTFQERRKYLAERTGRSTRLRVVRLRAPREFEAWLENGLPGESGGR